MASFSKTPTLRAPFGKNVYQRSTKGQKYESSTLAATSVVAETIDGTLLKVAQSGETMAKITSGPEAGKIGPYQPAGTVEVQTATKSGTWTSGTYDITVPAYDVTAEDIAIAANAATIQAALEAAGVPEGAITVTGGPLSTTPVVFTYNYLGENVGMITIDLTNLVGGGTVAVAETTAGVAGAVDGRQTAANIVGLLDTFLPWELNERDAVVSVCYEVAAHQDWCFERNGAGARVVLGNTTRDAIVAHASLSIIFK